MTTTAAPGTQGTRPPLRIGGASAFWGDSAIGIEQLVASGEVDVLVFDYLAELTMSLLARARVKDPAAGYATDFVTDLAPHLKSIAAQGIKLLSNAGGMNPQACATALRTAAEAAGCASEDRRSAGAMTCARKKPSCARTACARCSPARRCQSA